MQALRAATAARAASTQAFPSYLVNAPATEVTTLNNGVRVASEVSTANRHAHRYATRHSCNRAGVKGLLR